MSRDQVIIRTSVIGVIVNVLLSAMKAIVGLLSSSIAIVMDAVNNLSDALSSTITIIGERIATRKPDKKHPLGHGRVEYVSASLIAVIVLYAGFTSLIESIKKIITPEVPEYGAVTLSVVAAAVGAKLVLGLYVKKKGEQVQSDSLINSGKDALFDAVISVATLVSAVLFLTLHIQTEAWLGAAISLWIIKAGVDMFRETMSKIIGERADPALTLKIKKTICNEVPEVQGVFDLFLHDYGPEQKLGSCHVEVVDTMRADEIDVMTRKIQELVYTKHNVIMEAVGIYSYNTSGDYAETVRDDILHMMGEEPWVLQMHGFYLDLKTKKMNFDIIVDFAAPDRKKVYEDILKKVREKYGEYQIHITQDLDISD